MNSDRLRQTIEENGKELARAFSLDELALKVEAAAPSLRNKWAAEARIPWSLIYAIRQRRIIENR